MVADEVLVRKSGFLEFKVCCPETFYVKTLLHLMVATPSNLELVSTVTGTIEAIMLVACSTGQMW